MADAKHTPGPWEHGECGRVNADGCWERTFSRAVVSLDPTDPMVATVWGNYVSVERVLANARLIAASPAMYAYIARRAGDGDAEAIAILEGIGR